MSNAKSNPTQADIILKHLQSETITSFEAIERYGITRLAAVISQLRAKGYKIVARNKTVTTRYGKTTVAVYELRDGEDDE